MKRLWERYGWLCLPLVLLGWYIPQLASTVTTANGGADGGELASAVWLGGVPHPPGYPTYLLAGQVAMHVPWGEPAWRLALLSAVAAAASAAVLGATTLTADETPPSQRWQHAAGASTALIIGTSPRLVAQTVIVEVYLLALLMLSLLLWMTARWWRNGHTRTLIALGIVLGLGIGIQLPILAWCIGVGGAAWLRHKRLAWRSGSLVGLFALLGISVYSVLWWRGQRVPNVSWGDWTSVHGAWAHITASEYRYLVGITTWPQRLARLRFVIRDIIEGLGIGGFGLALLGIMRGRTIAGWRALSAGIAISTIIWAIGYGGADSQAYLLPLHALGAIWAGHGIAWLLGLPQDVQFKKWIVLLVSIGLLLPPQRLSPHSLRTATAERDRAIQRLLQQPTNAILFTNDDRDTFPLWYAQRVLGIRADVTIIDQRLDQYAWYRRQQQRPH